MAFGTRSIHIQHQKAADNTFPARLRAWRKRENLSQSEAALRGPQETAKDERAAIPVAVGESRLIATIEGYVKAEALLDHLDDVRAMLAEALMSRASSQLRSFARHAQSRRKGHADFLAECAEARI